MRRLLLVPLVASLLAPLAGPVAAQPAGPDAPPPDDPEAAPAPAAPPPPADAGQPQPQPPAAGPGTGVPEADEALDEAVGALVRGELDRAEVALARAATLAPDEQTRAVALRLAARVRQLKLARAAARPVPPLPPPAIAPRPAFGPVGVEPEDTGRPMFLLTTTLAGFALYGWALPTALGLDADEHTRWVVGLYMLTAAGSFVGPWALTRETPVTWAQANLAFYGATRGLEYGVLLGGLLVGEDADEGRALVTSMFLGSAAGLAGGFLWGGTEKMTAGEARTTAVLGDFGLFAGFVAGRLLGLDQHDRPFEDRDADTQARGMAAAGLVGSAAGLVVGRGFSRLRDNTWGDGEVLRGGGLVGLHAGFTAAVLAGAEPEDAGRGLFALLLGGTAAGLALGDHVVKGKDFSVGHSILVDLSLVAGGLGGAGLAFILLDPDDGDGDGEAEGKAVLAASLFGAGAGYLGAATALGNERRPDALSRALGPVQVGIVPQLGRRGERGLAVAGRF